VGIKTEADAAFFVHNDRQRDLAVRLDELFDVTFGASHGSLSFWLADPKPHAKERFGLIQEVLVVYSPFDKTDARVMTAFENISRAPEFRNRVEKVVAILIHGGDLRDTADLVRQQQERIIVPISTSDLMSPSRGSMFLSSRIAEAIGSVDLFGMTSPPTSDRYFFGRDQLVAALVHRTAVQRQNSGLFGLRKTGKTSVLFAVRRRLAERPILVEYIDCSNPGIHAARWWQVLDNLVQKCAQTLERDRKRKAQVVGGYTQTNAGIRFASDMLTLLKAGDLQQVVLMLDEIEYVTHGLTGTLGQHWDEDFVPLWQTIRSVHQETAGNVVFVVAGVNPACVETSHFRSVPNPIFQLAVPHYLRPLTTPEIREMVRTMGRYAGLRFNENVYDYLAVRFGGHPFLIRIACSEVWKSADVLNPASMTEIGRDRFVGSAIKSRLAQPMRDILLSLVWWYPEEYDVLRILAEGDVAFVQSYMNSHSASLVRFAQYGLLKGEGGEFAIADLRDFLAEHGDTYKKELSPFARGDMPAELLPEVPDLELLGRLFEKRTDIEIKLRKAVIVYIGVKCNWDPQKMSDVLAAGLHRRPDRQNPTELFVGRSPQKVVNELYTLDLKTIVTTNWDVFGPLFDSNRSRFEMNMDTMNRARRVDGHSKPVSEDERIEFENSYAWLQARLSKMPV
jgi:hypothetical protein